MASRVLVTGGSGFIAGHCIRQLLQSGYEVRTTVRKLAREADVRAFLQHSGVEPGDRLGVLEADLTGDAGWAQAAAGCEYVLHVASPFPAGVPAHEDELIVPAREGALRVLRAARAAGVRRVVMTSSFAAIGYGSKPLGRPYDERDWTDPATRISAYVKSKTLAERAAWDFIAREGGALELATVNPVAVFGPVAGGDFAASVEVVRMMLAGAMPGAPRLWFGVVDVRDVADLHLRAMVTPAARGERFLAVSGDFLSLFEIAQILRRRLGAAAARAPRHQLPDWLVRLGALVSPAARQVVPELGKVKNGSGAKARSLLGWSPRPPEEAIVASAESLLRLGLVKPRA